MVSSSVNILRDVVLMQCPAVSRKLLREKKPSVQPYPILSPSLGNPPTCRVLAAFGVASIVSCLMIPRDVASVSRQERLAMVRVLRHPVSFSWGAVFSVLLILRSCSTGKPGEEAGGG